tara:strand:- start:239 stop:553 length:315 start_codon:yes stop_codon:yes gene_type:complete
MNLDDAIKSSLTKTQMEGAMQGVMASWGPNFELHAVAQNAKNTNQTVSKKIGVMNHSPVPRAVLGSQPNKSVSPKSTPFYAPKGMESTVQTGNGGINPQFMRTI